VGAKLQTLLQQLDPTWTLDAAAEEQLLQLADDFLEKLSRQTLRLAQHRGSKSVDAIDVQLALAKGWNLVVPGLGPPPTAGTAATTAKSPKKVTTGTTTTNTTTATSATSTVGGGSASKPNKRKSSTMGTGGGGGGGGGGAGQQPPTKLTKTLSGASMPAGASAS
jgi:hypothetical protein